MKVFGMIKLGINGRIRLLPITRYLILKFLPLIDLNRNSVFILPLIRSVMRRVEAFMFGFSLYNKVVKITLSIVCSFKNLQLSRLIMWTIEITEKKGFELNYAFEAITYGAFWNFWLYWFWWGTNDLNGDFILSNRPGRQSWPTLNCSQSSTSLPEILDCEWLLSKVRQGWQRGRFIAL